jgi:hypothetical protein
MSDDEMATEALSQVQRLDGDAQAFASASQEPSMPADEATMPMKVSDMFDDDEDA